MPYESAITEESEISEFNFDGSIGSIEDYHYSDSENLPEREVEETVKIVGKSKIDPKKLAAKMNRVR